MPTPEPRPMPSDAADGVGLAEQAALWAHGFTRRKFLAGAGMAGVAALGSQLVTTRGAYAAVGRGTGNVVVTVFLRGAADGLRALIPATGNLGIESLHAARPALVPGQQQLLALPGAAGWSLNRSLAPLLPLWSSGELAFIPAVSADNISRSHFQAQQSLEKGGSENYSTGWLERTLAQLGPGTAFRAISSGGSTPASLTGPEPTMALASLKQLALPGSVTSAHRRAAAVAALYRGINRQLPHDVLTTIGALSIAERAARSVGGPRNGAQYRASSNSSSALKNIATIIRAGVGLEVATVDLGGWDTHTNEAAELDGHLHSAAGSLAAFMTDLGPTLRRRVTVVVMTEFGRRVATNASGGTDHGHGSLVWLLGGGLSRSGVFGKWVPLGTDTALNGDVPGTNNMYDVLGELLQKRLGIGSLGTIFPRHSYRPLGLARRT